MSQIAIWLDRHSARVFNFSGREFKTSAIRATRNPSDRESEGRMFSELVNAVSGADALLILGPGVAKHHFFNHLAEHHPIIAKGIVGCEATELAPDQELAERARGVFNKRASA